MAMSTDDMERTLDPGSPSWVRRIGNNLWSFFNTPVGVWLLTSGLVGLGIGLYQQRQQGLQQRSERAEKVELLNLEIAARMSQFGTWARDHLLQSSDSIHTFKPGVNESKITESIRELGNAPDSNTPVSSALEKGDKVDIFGIFPENRTRNLFSLYAGLQSVVGRQLENQDIDASLLTPKIKLYQYAEQVLIDPAALFGYTTLDHDVFICQFQKTFLTKDIGQFGLPSTDCLENKIIKGQPGECITYESVPECESLRHH
jgi:hypothetical protein